MSCRLRPLVGVLTLAAACTDSVTIIELQTRAAMAVQLAPPVEAVPDDTLLYRWDLISAPTHSAAMVPAGDAIGTLQVDLRGIYTVERSVIYGLTEDLSHRFIIHASPTQPVAVPNGTTQVIAGMQASVNGSKSYSLEGLPLFYQWRIATKPSASQAVLSATNGDAVTFVPDLGGEYFVELIVSDGEITSAPAQIKILAIGP